MQQRIQQRVGQRGAAPQSGMGYPPEDDVKEGSGFETSARVPRPLKTRAPLCKRSVQRWKPSAACALPAALRRTSGASWQPSLRRPSRGKNAPCGFGLWGAKQIQPRPAPEAALRVKMWAKTQAPA